MRRVIVNSTPLIALCNADLLNILKEIIYVFLTIFLYLLKCPQSLIL